MDQSNTDANAAYLGREKKNLVLPSATDPSQKIKFDKVKSGMHPIFVRLRVFSPFLRKYMENAPKYTFGCFLKI